MPTTIHDLRRQQSARRAGPAPAVIGVAALLAVGGTVAYFAGAFGHRMASADTLDGTFDRYVDAVTKMNDALDDLRSPADLPAHAADVGRQLDLLATDVDHLRAHARQLPPFDAADLHRVEQARDGAIGVQIKRWDAAQARLRESVDANSPLFAPLIHAGTTVSSFPLEVQSIVDDRQRESAQPSTPSAAPSFAQDPSPAYTPPSPSPPHAPAIVAGTESRGRDAVMLPGFSPDQAIAIHLYGLTDRSPQLDAITTGLQRRLGADLVSGVDDPADPHAAFVTIAPADDPAAIAAAIDFGRLTLGTTPRSLRVDVDPARLDAITQVAKANQPPGPAPTGQPSTPAAADPQRLTVRIDGLNDPERTGPLIGPELERRLAHRFQRTGPVRLVDGHLDPTDPTVYVLVFTPVPDVRAAVGPTLSIGRPVPDVASRTITVEANLDQVAFLTRTSPLPTRGPMADFGPDQIVTVHLRGLTGAQKQIGPLMNHIRERAKARDGMGTSGSNESADVRVAPVADAATVAAAIDFGTATVDAASRSVTVDCDPARVAALVAAAAPPAPVVTPPPPPPVPVETPPAQLPAVVPVGTRIGLERNGQWCPATVLKREGRRYLVHADADADAANEWVGKDRMRPADAG